MLDEFGNEMNLPPGLSARTLQEMERGREVIGIKVRKARVDKYRTDGKLQVTEDPTHRMAFIWCGGVKIAEVAFGDPTYPSVFLMAKIELAVRATKDEADDGTTSK